MKSPHRGGRYRGRALAVLSGVLGLAIGLCVLEVFLRVLGLAPSRGVVTVTEAQFESVPGLLAPNQDIVDLQKRALPHRVRVNSLGYRGSALTWRKAANERRILMVGDSFTFGDFVNDDETLPAQLERELQKRCGAVRVVNGGIGGTTIDAHVRMVERALALEPDLVILTFSENDLDDLTGPSAWDQLAANRRLKSRPPLSIVYPTLTRLALWHFALEARAKLRARTAASAAGHDSASQAVADRRLAARRRMLPEYAAALRGLRDRLEARAIGLVLALFPSHLSLREGGSIEQLEWLARLGREAAVETIDLRLPLERSGHRPEHLYLLPHDGHPSPLGYGIAAAALSDTLTHGALVGEACGAR